MSELIFERSRPQRRCVAIPDRKVHEFKLDDRFVRQQSAQLPEVAEVDLVRHYVGLSRQAFGVDNGFYPLGSCTMKYNPKVNETAASLSGFNDIHPLQPENTVEGCLAVQRQLTDALIAITGMDDFTLQPAAGAHGEFTGMQLVRAYHHSRNDDQRNQIIIPDSAHGTNPASAAMNGFTVVAVASNADGGIDIDALQQAVNEHTAALMLTNPNTLGLFDRNIEKITEIVHQAGGLCYYDGANLNAIMGICRPGDMGFDIVHLNLHKTFSTPHGGGGPGSGPVGCKQFLAQFLPYPTVDKTGTHWQPAASSSIGKVRSYYGNFLICVRALAYIKTLGADGLKLASENAVLNANYLRLKLKDMYTEPYQRACMHEFVVSLHEIKTKYNVSAKDVAKALLDWGIHPPTMYFPMIVSEALMFEPTETEGQETLDQAVAALTAIYEQIQKDPQPVQTAPHTTIISHPDEVKAARQPILRWTQE